MKLKKIIILSLIILIIIGVNTKSYAKYAFEYTIKAAEITINN